MEGYLGHDLTLPLGIRWCFLFSFLLGMCVERSRQASSTGGCPPTWSPELGALCLQRGAQSHQAVALPILAREAIDLESVIRAKRGLTITHFWQVTLIFCWSAHCTTLFNLQGKNDKRLLFTLPTTYLKLIQMIFSLCPFIVKIGELFYSSLHLYCISYSHLLVCHFHWLWACPNSLINQYFWVCSANATEIPKIQMQTKTREHLRCKEGSYLSLCGMHLCQDFQRGFNV